MKNSVRNGETVDYTTQTFFAISGAIDEMRANGDALVTIVNDPAALERYAMDVASIEPRADLLPLGEDETRAYRLDRYDAVIVVRKRRSAAMVPFPPVSRGLPSPLMTDIVVVRTVAGERVVHPLYRSVKGTDSWGKGEPTIVHRRFRDRARNGLPRVPPPKLRGATSAALPARAGRRGNARVRGRSVRLLTSR